MKSTISSSPTRKVNAEVETLAKLFPPGTEILLKSGEIGIVREWIYCQGWACVTLQELRGAIKAADVAI